jgi:hypothetical protein
MWKFKLLFSELKGYFYFPFLSDFDSFSSQMMINFIFSLVGQIYFNLNGLNLKNE